MGLLPGKRGPRRPHKITPEVARFIEQTVVHGEELAAQRLVGRIAERFGLVVRQRTVKRALARSKKSAVNPAAATLDGHALAARYEVLRHDMVASADRRHSLHESPVTGSVNKLH